MQLNKKRCKSDPGPADISKFITLHPRLLAPLSKKFGEIQTAQDMLEPDVLEVKGLPNVKLSCSSRELPKMSRRRRKLKLGKKLLQLLSSPFGLFLLLLVYMVLGALMFMYVETASAHAMHMKLDETRMEFAQILVLNESCHQDVECVSTWLMGWEEQLWKFPIGILDESIKLWSFENAFHLCFSIVTTIGKGYIFFVLVDIRAALWDHIVTLPPPPPPLNPNLAFITYTHTHTHTHTHIQ